MRTPTRLSRVVCATVLAALCAPSPATSPEDPYEEFAYFSTQEAPRIRGLIAAKLAELEKDAAANDQTVAGWMRRRDAMMGSLEFIRGYWASGELRLALRTGGIDPDFEQAAWRPMISTLGKCADWNRQLVAEGPAVREAMTADDQRRYGNQIRTDWCAGSLATAAERLALLAKVAGRKDLLTEVFAIDGTVGGCRTPEEFIAARQPVLEAFIASTRPTPPPATASTRQLVPRGPGSLALLLALATALGAGLIVLWRLAAKRRSDGAASRP